MSYLLHIEVSPTGNNSISRSISQDFVKSWSTAHEDGRLVLRDLAANPVPHLDIEAIYAGYTPESHRTASASAKHAYRLEPLMPPRRAGSQGRKLLSSWRKAAPTNQVHLAKVGIMEPGI